MAKMIPPVILRKLSLLPRPKLNLSFRRHKRRSSSVRGPTSPKQLLSSVLQRLPIFTHLCAALLAIFGPVYAPVAISVLFFCTQCIFVCSQIRSSYGMYKCWQGTKRHSQTDWYSYWRTESLRIGGDHVIGIEDVEHVIIVPNYKESLGTLRETLDVLASHPLAPTAYKVCLAMEEREFGSAEKAGALCQEYRDQFLDITFSCHPGSIPGESAGKSSNVAWATRYMAARELDVTKLAKQVITVMDADTAFAADFFLAISAKFALAKPDLRERMAFAPPLVFDRNAGDVPVFTRVTDIFWASSGAGGLFPTATVKIPTSAYAVSMSLAIYVDFWDAGPEAIGEDMHMYCKALFDTNGHLHMETIYSPASQCNVVGAPAKGFGRFFNDSGARWTQAIRHMWGSLDTGYIYRRILTRDFGVGSKESRTIRLDEDLTASELSSEYSSDDDYNCAPAQIALGGVTDAELAPPPPTPDTPFIPKGNNMNQVPAAKWKTGPMRITPFFFLCLRLYEAHIMIAHLFILVAILTFYPTAIISNGSFSIFQWPFSAPKVLSNFIQDPLSALKHTTNGTATGFFPMPGSIDANVVGKSVYWVMPDLVKNAIQLSQRIGFLGIIASAAMCVFHDLYHHEAAVVRWRNSARAEAEYNTPGSPTPSASSALTGTTIGADATPAIKTADTSDTIVDYTKDLESAPAFNSRYLGIRPAQVHVRHWPWALLDYAAIPGALLFGFAPLVVAQFRQIWTNRLVYTVSAKPVVVAQKKGMVKVVVVPEV